MSMVERVARAIQELMPQWLVEDGSTDDDALAHAAIAGMRDHASDAMLEAGESAARQNADLPCGISIQAINNIWGAMIDAALTDRLNVGEGTR